MICAPILAREQVLGVIYLDCPTSTHTYIEPGTALDYGGRVPDGTGD